MLKWYKKETLLHILWLTIIYVAAHWFLLVTTGKWWDDWVYANHNVEYLIDVCMQSSLPLDAFIGMSVWNLPYRWFVFLYFYLDGILVYFILRKINLFSSEACFWISALFVTIPINDARITWICYAYSFCFLLFWISFYLVTLFKKAEGLKKFGLRILSLLILGFAFNLESTMLMTLLILFYLYYEELKDDWRWNEIRVNIKKFIIAVFHYIDFLIAPMAWYVLDKVLFPGYGKYGGHSYIPWDRLLGIVLRSPLYAFNSLIVVALNYAIVAVNGIVEICIIVILIAIVAGLISRKKRKDKIAEEPLQKKVLMVILGALVFYICFFPYGVKRDSHLGARLISGRDSVLLGIGTAILIYYGVYVLFREEICKIILVFAIILGVVHFNFTYLIWQESYYQQLLLQNEIAENAEIQNNNTFLVMYKNAAMSYTYYQNTGNSWAVTGEETRFFMTGVEDLVKLYEMNEDSWILNYTGMKDYDYTDKKIDGIIFVNYTDIGEGVMLKQKWNELFNKEAFDKWIKSIKDIQYVPISSDESDMIREKYQSGELTDATIYEWYYGNMI